MNRAFMLALMPGLPVLWATLPTGEKLILVSGMLEVDAALLLQTYRQCWQIERFHYSLKETLELSHRYGFQQNGLALLAHVAEMLSALLLLAADAGRAGGLTVDRLQSTLKAARRDYGVWGLRRRNNMCNGQTRRRKEISNVGGICHQNLRNPSKLAKWNSIEGCHDHEIDYHCYCYLVRRHGLG